MTLAQKHCLPCKAGQPALTEEQENQLLGQLSKWTLTKEKDHRLTKKFLFDDFRATIAFADKIGDLAETEGHHPELHVYYGELRVELSTHAVHGLTENDFILAAKIDALS